MRMSNEEKQRSHGRIVTQAGRLFRERGVEGASLADVMAGAGMTHGGFYRHFPDKESLLIAAIEQAFAGFAEALDDVPEDRAAEAAADFRTHYLSADHLGAPGLGCPAPTLGPDVMRSGPKVRAAFGAGLDRMIAGLARGNGHGPGARRQALRDLSMLVGAVVMARAVNDEFAAEILAACREAEG